MTIEDRIKLSETRIFKAVFPNTTNHYGTLFGGTALQLMDEASFICATRFSRKRMVTISSDKIDFDKAIPEGSIIELIAKVIKVGKTSCKIKVDIYTERMYSNERELAVTGCFTFVAINEYKNPIPVV
jgi:acyl-CoA hydrolase|tara:strand:+ start:610 stop:993 length:384 start_codon:yes stop_codon:yes gene_type:complete